MFADLKNAFRWSWKHTGLIFDPLDQDQFFSVFGRSKMRKSDKKKPLFGQKTCYIMSHNIHNFCIILKGLRSHICCMERRDQYCTVKTSFFVYCRFRGWPALGHWWVHEWGPAVCFGGRLWLRQCAADAFKPGGGSRPPGGPPHGVRPSMLLLLGS